VEYGILNIHPGSGYSHSPSAPDAPPPPPVGPASTLGTVLAYPNPFSNSVAFSYSGSVVIESVSVSVYSASGHLVWTQEFASLEEASWDGTDDTGERLANGPYLYVIAATDGASAYISRGKLFIRR